LKLRLFSSDTCRQEIPASAWLRLRLFSSDTCRRIPALCQVEIEAI
jgi:hypothetical protein